jgi:hypothetical protein
VGGAFGASDVGAAEPTLVEGRPSRSLRIV